MPTEYPQRKMKTRDLKIADVVETGGFGGFTTALVKQVKDGIVTLYRPYGTHADFSCTSGVICYVGIEEFTVSQDSDSEWFVHRRQDLS